MTSRWLVPLTLLAGAAALGCPNYHGTSPIPAPSVTGIVPLTGTVGTRLSITGTNFYDNATVLIGTLAADSVTVLNQSTLYAYVPAGVAAGSSYPVSVDNGSGTAQGPDSFTAVPPTLIYANGASRPTAALGSSMVLEGTAFGDLQGPGQVLFSDGSGGTVAGVVTAPADWSDGEVAVTVPAGAATGTVTIQTGTGSASLPLAIPTPTFNPAAVSWQTTTPLPMGLSGHAAVYATLGGTGTSAKLVYVIGGSSATSAATTGVIAAQVQSSGLLGTWTTLQALPGAVAFHSAVAATRANSRITQAAGYLYVLGGVTDATGTPTAAIVRGTLDSTGVVTTWTTLTTALPEPLQSFGAVLYHGDLYVIGGATTGFVPSAAVYRSQIDSTGALGAWQTEIALPFPRAYSAVTAIGDYLYVWGGDSALVTPNDANASVNTTKLARIAYAPVDAFTGDLSLGWITSGTPLPTAVSKETVVAVGDTVLATGGLYAGATTGAFEESFAPVDTSGAVGTFTTLGAGHTILGAGGGSLFNQAAVSYVDATGTGHVLVLGGDDVNTPGTRHAQVWIY